MALAKGTSRPVCWLLASLLLRRANHHLQAPHTSQHHLTQFKRLHCACKLRVKMTAEANVPEGVLLSLGNPLLDITCVTDEAFLAKYKLEANNVILAEPHHHPMFHELKAMNPEYVAGGATQNSVRIAQWMLQKKNATVFFGCVGNDDNAEILRKKAKEAGVNVIYMVHPTIETGVCGAVITGENRSLVAELNAALHFNHSFLKQPENWEVIEKARVFYVGGFPFSVSPESVKMIAHHACEKNKILIMNLSATYLIKYFIDPEIDIMPYVDYLFGNETEAATFCKEAGLKVTDLQSMAEAVANLPKKNQTRKRTVIFTQGREPTVSCHEGKVMTYPILPVEKSLIKDTNGCGDSFVGGFVSQLVQGKAIDECLRCGNYCARVVIQHYGCTYPPKPDFK